MRVTVALDDGEIATIDTVRENFIPRAFTEQTHGHNQKLARLLAQFFVLADGYPPALVPDVARLILREIEGDRGFEEIDARRPE